MKTKHTARATSMGFGIGMGVALSLLACLLGAMILAWLIASRRLSENGIGYGSMVILFVSAWIGTELAWRMIRHRHILVSAITACAYFLVLLLLGFCLGGGMEAVGVTALMICLGGAVGFLPQLLGLGSGGRRVRKHHSR